jgi:tRNA G10  N-methylase Trm11
LLETERKLQIPTLPKELFPEGYELLPGTNQIYELELALGEFRSLSSSDLVARSAYFQKVDGQETHHYLLCADSALRTGENSARLKSFFQAYRFKTSYATHGLFPYRGKFHPQLIKAIMNTIGLRRGETILDPMMGSGTTNIEASLIGINSIGIDASPFCRLIAQTKVDAMNMNLEEFLKCAKNPIGIFDYFNSRENQRSLISDETEKTCGLIPNSDIYNLFLLCYLDSVGYARRRKSKNAAELFPVVLERYVQALTNFIMMKKKLGLQLGKSTIIEGDARNLNDLSSETLTSIQDETIDGIITSPPYSFAIDYLEGDRTQLEYFGYDIKSLRNRMIGLRGSDLKNKVYNYFEDMNKTVEEMSRVLKEESYCVIIIGSNTAQLERALTGMGVNLEDELTKIAEKHDLGLSKRITRPIEGIRNVMKNESVLFLKKGKTEG